MGARKHRRQPECEHPSDGMRQFERWSWVDENTHGVEWCAECGAIREDGGEWIAPRSEKAAKP